ncbi:efflux RND transporter periplasmic adaptor subunit [Bizionia argentinensis JUB59]|uniref:Efflux RND transporter periplasmic adaptor subunit n=1 Tax=Bizionia argentinensis JUB59 TaxID=1046627 RepID=G2EDW5_9FLAO|nr:efflux RND transporter periplasmic adaptor subunit [Bizionia argentinensis]EGV43327.2 efflux RND transporter periplasmic adaptor subunit [Bizionia argentinensis JUB59]
MKNNKVVIYIGILAIGVLLGWVLFSGGSSSTETHDHDTVAETNQMWTCSMHPQIMQPEPGDCPICGMDLIPAESSADGLMADEFKLTENAMALANIQTSVVGSTDTQDKAIKLSGKIVENEESNAVQVSYFSGRIERLNVSFTGEEIRKGQLLATIYSPELYAAQQELLTAASIKESQPALYKAVRNKLKLWKLSENQINQIEESGEVKENMPVYATVSGVVTEKLVEQGDYVKQGQPLLKVANLSSVWGNFDVYENQIDLFKKGQEVKVTSNAYPNKEFKGKVDFINPTLNTATRTVSLRVILDNKNGVFKPGMFVKAIIENVSDNKGEVITIPSSAVLWTGERSVIYIKTNPHEPVFEMKEVVLGNRIGDNYEIAEGLSNGDEIVTNGTFTVDAAAQLQSKKSMMNNSKSNTGHDDHQGTDSPSFNTNERLKVSVDFQKQLKVVFDDYIKLKDALVEDKSKKVSAEAENLLTNLANIDMKLLSDDKAHNHWMTLEKEIKMYANSIAYEKDIASQRNHFKPLSSYMANALEVFGINEKVYHQFCPMADNDKGAYWLSREEHVLNPYFGDAMLKCGDVKQVIE